MATDSRIDSLVHMYVSRLIAKEQVYIKEHRPKEVRGLVLNKIKSTLELMDIKYMSPTTYKICIGNEVLKAYLVKVPQVINPFTALSRSTQRTATFAAAYGRRNGKSVLAGMKASQVIIDEIFDNYYAQQMDIKHEPGKQGHAPAHTGVVPGGSTEPNSEELRSAAGSASGGSGGNAGSG